MSDFQEPIERRRFLQALMMVPFLGVPVHGAVAGESPENYVKQVASQVMQIANTGQKGNGVKNRFATLLNRYINLHAIANMALGPYQKTITAPQRQELYVLFSNYAAALFAYYVEDFRGDGLTIKSSTKQGKFITVQSAIMMNGGEHEQVKWRLIDDGGTYRVSDVNVKGVWLTIATKKRFTDVLNKSKGDFEPLFASLREADTW